MDYKEKYEQALSRARQFSEKPYLEDSAGIVEYIFPELASEDERIRKEIIDFATKANNGVTSILANNYDFNSWLAWLEKQASPVLSNSSNVGKNEHNPTWSEEDEEILKLIKFAVSNLPSQREDTRQECLDWLESLKNRIAITN